MTTDSPPAADVEATPPRRPLRTRRGLTLAISAAVAVLLAVAALVIPVPYVELAPGPATDTLGTVSGEPLISVHGRAVHPTTGHLYLVTVEVAGGPVSPLTLEQAIAGYFSASTAIVPASVIYPPGQTTAQVQHTGQVQMTGAQDSATVAALCELAEPVCKVDVASTVAGTDAARDLKPGDWLTQIDGQRIVNNGTLLTVIRAHPIGTRFTLEVVRNHQRRSFVVASVANPDVPGRPMLGVSVDQQHLQPYTVRIDLPGVGGPSAGLMFALGIMSKIGGVNLTGGATIAGTGEIDDNGNVSPIGGIQQKLAAARRVGATVFLVPADNCADARSADPAGLRLVKVTSLSDAVASLEALQHGGSVPPC